MLHSVICRAEFADGNVVMERKYQSSILNLLTQTASQLEATFELNSGTARLPLNIREIISLILLFLYI